MLEVVLIFFHFGAGSNFKLTFDHRTQIPAFCLLESHFYQNVLLLTAHLNASVLCSVCLKIFMLVFVFFSWLLELHVFFLCTYLGSSWASGRAYHQLDVISQLLCPVLISPCSSMSPLWFPLDFLGFFFPLQSWIFVYIIFFSYFMIIFIR